MADSDKRIADSCWNGCADEALDQICPRHVLVESKAPAEGPASVGTEELGHSFPALISGAVAVLLLRIARRHVVDHRVSEHEAIVRIPGPLRRSSCESRQVESPGCSARQESVWERGGWFPVAPHLE